VACLDQDPVFLHILFTVYQPRYRHGHMPGAFACGRLCVSVLCGVLLKQCCQQQPTKESKG